jgi:dATP pyrophosphohydrolase
MRQPVQVLVYIARPANGGWEYLILHRVPKLDSFWQGVTGGVEEGEQLEETARREVLEETGFASLELEQIDYSYTFPVKAEWRGSYGPGVNEIQEYVFLARVESGEPALSWEHDAMRWCGLEAALELLTWPENKGALRRCDARLVARRQGSNSGGGGDPL